MTGASVFLPAALFLTLCFGNALDATHHWFSILAVMAGLAVMIQHRSLARIAGAGALCGLAACFTQSRGGLAVLAMALFLVWEWRATKRSRSWLARREVCLFAAFLAVSVPFVAYFIWKAGMKSLVDCTFRFPPRYYAAFNRNNLGVYMVDAPDLPWPLEAPALGIWLFVHADRKSTRLNSSHGYISYAVFCLKKKTPSRPRARTRRGCGPRSSRARGSRRRERA